MKTSSTVSIESHSIASIVVPVYERSRLADFADVIRALQLACIQNRDSESRLQTAIIDFRVSSTSRIVQVHGIEWRYDWGRLHPMGTTNRLFSTAALGNTNSEVSRVN